jgi:hypothetical protein
MLMAEYSSEMINTLAEEMILRHNNASSKNRTFGKVILNRRQIKFWNIHCTPLIFSM